MCPGTFNSRDFKGKYRNARPQSDVTCGWILIVIIKLIALVFYEYHYIRHFTTCFICLFSMYEGGIVIILIFQVRKLWLRDAKEHS